MELELGFIIGSIFGVIVGYIAFGIKYKDLLKDDEAKELPRR